jgi:hypothetical protein
MEMQEVERKETTPNLVLAVVAVLEAQEQMLKRGQELEEVEEVV